MVGRQMNGTMCLDLESVVGGRGRGVKHVERLEKTGSGTSGTAGRGATPDARPAWDRVRSRQKLAEDGRGGCVTRAGRGVGWVWLGVGEG